MSELQRLKGLLPPENQSWVFIEAAAAIDPPLITLEEIGRDEVEIQVDLEQWDYLAQDHRNLLFWHEVGRIQNDTIPRDGWEMAALAIGLGGAIGELWVQDGLLLLMALGLSGFAGYRLYLKNNSEKRLQDAISADERAIDLACRFGYSVPNAYKSLGGALKDLVEKQIDNFLYAGEVALDLRNKGLNKEIKSDGTPVSNGELEVNRIITEKIIEITPEIPIISEETSDNKSLKELKDFWLVDPIDGTYDYINNLDEFTINAGLIINRKPVAGLIYAPAKDRMFYSYGDDLALSLIHI